MDEVKYPECEKLAKVSSYAQKIGDFLDWLRHRGVLMVTEHKHDSGCYDKEDLVCGYETGEYQSFHVSIENLLAEYFGIDMRKIEEERRQILEDIRSGNVK